MKKTFLKGFFATLLLAAAFMLFGPSGKAAAATCTWTAGGSDDNFSTTSNWSGCGGLAPQNGDDLVFPVTASSVAPINDLSGRSFTSMTFNGVSASTYTVTGNALTITSAITDNSSATSASTSILTDITLGGTVTISGTHASTGGDALGFNNIALSTNNLTISTIHANVAGALSGSGSLALTSGGTLLVTSASPSYTGSMTVASGSYLAGGVINSLGSGAITVQSGGTASVGDSSSQSATFPNPITLAGTGLNSQGALIANIGTGGTLTLANVTLSADASIGTGGNNVVVQSLTRNGFVLSSTGGGTLTINESGSSTPTAPDAGIGLLRSNPAIVLAITLLCTATLLALAKGVHATQKRS